MITLSNNIKPRKPYAKPRIAIEEFTQNQFIANCTVNTNEQDWLGQLAEVSFFDYMNIMRTKQFVKSLDCIVDADAVTDDMDTICYHTSTSPLFGS